jgi:hypothetical protein
MSRTVKQNCLLLKALNQYQLEGAGCSEFTPRRTHIEYHYDLQEHSIAHRQLRSYAENLIQGGPTDVACERLLKTHFWGWSEEWEGK